VEALCQSLPAEVAELPLSEVLNVSRISPLESGLPGGEGLPAGAPRKAEKCGLGAGVSRLELSPLAYWIDWRTIF